LRLIELFPLCSRGNFRSIHGNPDLERVHRRSDIVHTNHARPSADGPQCGRQAGRQPLVDRPAVPGPLTVAWDGADDDGRVVPPGVYLARATFAGQSADRKVVRIP